MCNCKLSIIIPYYNTENYINYCLNSIVTQSLQNYEIIIVDDGSNIPCSNIISKFLENFENISVITHNTNKGLFQSRLTGFEYATGDYIAFCDSDDFVSCDFYRPMIAYAQKHATDIVANTFAVHHSKNNYSEYYNLDPFRNAIENLYDSNIFANFMQQRGLFWGWHTVWNKIYKTTLFKKCLKDFKYLSEQAPKLIMCEDLAFSTCLFFKATSFHVIRYGYYFYCKHEEQSTNNNDIKKYKNNVRDVYAVFNFIKNYLLKNNVFSKFEREYYDFYYLYAKMYYDIALRLGIKAKKFITNIFNIKELNIKYKNESFLYSITTSLNPAFLFYEDIRKKIIDDHTKYVSFDIFDTAILRRTFQPKDIFTFLDIEYKKKFNKSDYIFSKIRIEAEIKVRHLNNYYSNKEDINLKEIYDYIKKNYFFEESIVDYLYHKEIDIELSFTTRRNFVYELYQLAKHCGKKIFFTTDMYLPKEVLEKILKNNGYNEYDSIFISSEIGLTKNTGNLYKYIMENKKIQQFEILHIGDNWNDDVIMANRNKFNSGFIPKTTQLLMNSNPGTPTGNLWNKICLYDKEIINRNYIFDNYFVFRCMLATVANKIFDDPSINYHQNSDFNCSPYLIGYFALGMHLYAVADWLIKKHNLTKTKKLHFISRDGYLPMKAYEIMAQRKKSLPSPSYFYSSRKATIPLYYKDEKDIGTLINIINIYSVTPIILIYTFSVYIKDFDIKKISKNCLSIGIVPTKPFIDVKNFYNFMKKILIPLFDNNKIITYHEKFKNYLNININNGDSIFDVGYSGRLETLITLKTKFHLSSFYMYTYDDKHLINFENSGNTLTTFYDFTPRGNTALRETLFSAFEPSCIGYNFSNNEKPYIFDKFNECDIFLPNYIFTCIQNAALDFIKDYTNIFIDYINLMPYKHIVPSLPYEVFLNFLEREDLNIFNCFDFEDDLFLGSNMNITDTYKQISINENPIDSDKNLWIDRAMTLKNSKWFNIGRLIGIIKYDW